jgi:hypothetical protein
MPGTRLREGYAGAPGSLGRRSFSEGGKAGHDDIFYVSTNVTASSIAAREVR